MKNPLNDDVIEDMVKPCIENYVNVLNGRFKEHVSDDFLKAYLLRNFKNNYRKDYIRSFESLAYYAAISLFESDLEYGCKIIMNGHHVAQNFASFFSKECHYKEI